jgi:hypothetical protein
MTPNTLKYAYIVHKTLLKSLQKPCQTVFSRFLSTIFILAENTRHSEKPGQNPAIIQDVSKNLPVTVRLLGTRFKGSLLNPPVLL